MKTWQLLHGGVLAASDEIEQRIATAEQVYASIVEHSPAWKDLPGGKHGAATKLSFSPYPVDAVIELYADTDARPAIRFEARTQLQRSFRLSPQALMHGHIVHDGMWHPVSSVGRQSVMALLNEHGLDLEALGTPTFHQCLALRRAAAIGKPVIDLLPNETLFGLSPIDLSARPQGVSASLYPYQVQGWQWLRFLAAERAGGLLADEMGLGKTLQIIAMLRDPGNKSTTSGSLVIAPGSLLENWYREIQKFCPDLHAIKHHGPDRTGSPADLRDFNVVITSYETATRDLYMLRMICWYAVVLDEAQNIRNPDTRRSKAVKRLRRCVSFAVTGTPVENHLRDLWSIMEFVNPRYLGDLHEFEARYTDNDADASSLEPLISPIILRRRVHEVASDLPPRIDIPEILELDEDEAKAYEQVRMEIAYEYGSAAKFASIMRLRQFCTHPVLLDKAQPLHEFTKFSRLKALIGEIFAHGEKVLAFTSFTSMADIITAMAKSEFSVFSATIDGRLAIVDRQLVIDRFTRCEGPALLVLNPRAGGSGLNITAANHVIQYNPEWNPAVEDQAAARVYRRGQMRPVTVRRLFMADTVEEVMDERLHRKREMAGKAIIGVRGEVSDYDDIIAALSRSPITGLQ